MRLVQRSTSNKFLGRHSAAQAAGFRSGLEVRIARQLKDVGHPVVYEQTRLRYIGKPRHYTPDFELRPGVFVECKGLFTGADRAKHLLVQKQHPDIEVRFVFTNPSAKLSKSSKTTYAAWCEQHGFQYAKQTIPEEWFSE